VPQQIRAAALSRSPSFEEALVLAKMLIAHHPTLFEIHCHVRLGSFSTDLSGLVSRLMSGLHQKMG
jgi:hypothetical protein